MYSPPGSVGAAACLYRPPCTSEDYTFEVTECIDDRRELIFKLKQPQICNIDAPGAIVQPKNEKIYCRGCGRGEHRDENDKCVSCADGYYQDLDNHQMANGTKIQECKKCGAGNYAPKILDLGHFESFPD